MKINNLQGDLTDVSAKKEALVNGILIRLRVKLLLVSRFEAYLTCTQVIFDTTNALEVPKLAQFVRYPEGFVISRVA